MCNKKMVEDIKVQWEEFVYVYMHFLPPNTIFKLVPYCYIFLQFCFACAFVGNCPFLIENFLFLEKCF